MSLLANTTAGAVRAKVGIARLQGTLSALLIGGVLLSAHTVRAQDESNTDASAEVHKTNQPTNTVLLRLYEQDQADRQARLPSAALAQRDAERRNTAKKVLAKATLKSAQDFYHAAVIFQHGNSAVDFQKARQLAMKALALDPDHALSRWLAAASEDRRLMALGKPQLYGTQFKSTDGHWEVYDVDPRVSDTERAKWNVPPLADSKKRAAAMNR